MERSLAGRAPAENPEKHARPCGNYVRAGGRKALHFDAMDAFTPRWIARTAALALGWWLAGALALWSFPLDGVFATAWPASGLALGALLVWGRGHWPGIAIGSLALGIGAGLTPMQGVTYAIGSSLEAWLGATLILRFSGPQPGLGRLRDVLALVGWGAVAVTAAATITLALQAESLSRSPNPLQAIEPLAVWLGHAIGVLLVTPVILAFAHGQSPSQLKSRPWEALALVAVAVAVFATVFTNMSKALTVNPVPYLIFPVFFWGALRFGAREVSMLMLAVGAAAVVATGFGNGPFAEGRPLQNLVSLYLFLAIAVIPTLLLVATLEERRRAEQQSRQHLEQLAHVTRVSSMDEMASAMAHEINQPLSAIATFTQACLRLLARDPVDQAELVGAMQRVASEADRAGEIVRRIRRFVKNEPGQSIAVDLNFLVGEVIRLAQADARQSRVQLLTSLQPDLPKPAADPIQVQQVLLNLVRNAIEALNAAGSARREVTITTASGPKAVEVSVTDSGPGVADIERAFEPFYSTKAEGMGIGLAISRSIIEAHGGRLSGQSSPGHGATFRFTLPLDEAET
jgi:signal transduction histidine kinase